MITIGDLIRKYIEEIHPIKPIGSSHMYGLLSLTRRPLAAIEAEKLQASDIIEHCKARRLSGMTASTVHQDIIYLRGPLSMAKIAWNLNVSTQAIEDAKPLLSKLQLIGKSRPRDRRPSLKEFDELLNYFDLQGKRNKKAFIPMIPIMKFAVLSARRISEICRLRWDDINTQKRTCLVRDMKDPKHKKGNHHEFPLLGEAWNIVQAQPKTSEFIFPYNSRSVSQKYVMAKKHLGIKNLRFHDLRREAASRLFEQKYGVPEVMVMTGHKTPTMLLRTYTALKAEDLHREVF